MRLNGKGRKERLCPLWSETASLLRSLLQRRPRPDNEPIFVNRYGFPLGASGVRFKLAKYVEKAAKTVPSLRSKHVTPHSFRHATAVHLVAAGVDITVIRSWLGHVSLDTTNHYAQANLDTKRKALERLETSCKTRRPPRWKRDASVRHGSRFRLPRGRPHSQIKQVCRRKRFFPCERMVAMHDDIELIRA